MLHYCVVTFVFLAVGSTFALPEREAYFYIYEWPDQLMDVWPREGAKLHPETPYLPAFRPHNGVGEMLDEKVGLFQTWQFSLYANAMARLRTSKYRTRDPAKATAFFIPFDLGVHSYIGHDDGLRRLASPLAWNVTRYLQESFQNMENREIFWKLGGHDHFVLFGITVYQMVGIGVKSFFMGVCKHCSVLTIETTPTNGPIKGRSHKYFYALPYPSAYHYHEKLVTFPWAVKQSNEGDSSVVSMDAINRARPIVALFIGSVKTYNSVSNKLRRTMQGQCVEHGESCVWHSASHACNAVSNLSNSMLLFQHAQFCLAPTGDSVTRKSLFDSLTAGCIPVLNSKGSLKQYHWFISEDELPQISVYIPMGDIVERGVNFMKILTSIPARVIDEMQRKIEKIAPRLQYSVVPDRVMLQEQKGAEDASAIWEPPFADAASVLIDRVLDPRTIAPMQAFNKDQLLSIDRWNRALMFQHEDYTGKRAQYTDNSSKGFVDKKYQKKGKFVFEEELPHAKKLFHHTNIQYVSSIPPE